jgi:Rrf2 family protein
MPMRVSQKASYALRALIVLAQLESPGRVVPTSELARREKIPAKFLEGILVELRKAGLVTSQRGAEGGHRLARGASRITIGEVWRAMDGPLSPAASLNESGPRTLAGRGLQSVWEEVEQAVALVVDELTLEEVLRRVETRRGVVDYSI